MPTVVSSILEPLVSPFRSVVDGGPGHDTVMTGHFPDFVDGGSGDDVIGVRQGADRAHGGQGADRVETSGGPDEGQFFVIGEGGDRLFGDEGDDTLVSVRDFGMILDDPGSRDCVYATDQSLDGGDGDDVLRVGYGDQTLAGGPGRDVADYGDSVSMSAQRRRFELGGSGPWGCGRGSADRLAAR